MKKTIVFAILLFMSFKINAQTFKEKKSTYYINILINKNKEVRIESDLVQFKNLDKEIKKRIYNRPFKLDENVTYRVFADENLLLGYIMDVEEKLFAGYSSYTTNRKRYLLDTGEMQIDGPEWTKRLKELKFDIEKG